MLGARVHDDLLDEQAKLYIVSESVRSSVPKLSATGKPTCPPVVREEERKGTLDLSARVDREESRRVVRETRSKENSFSARLCEEHR